MTNSYLTVLDKLSSVIEGNKKYKVEDAINKNLLAEDARKYDADLLNLLQKDKTLKSHFFAETDGGLVFKKDVFLQFISNKEFLPDSYTKYANKIGLGSDDGSLLSGSKDVVLNWPYKDAILEGGQDKEDQKRSEVFFNEVLAPDQITRLLDDKVFTNWKRYDKDGERELDELKNDDNLIIKGNNLVVLHSLKKRYTGKVKLIYIDPPYNTGSDSFGYNDRFNHSTWLTFMKNRLEAARELLAHDGVVFISINDKEKAYLRILGDEIFGRDNYEETFYFKVRHENRILREDIRYQQVTEALLCYRKSDSYAPSRREKIKSADDDYIYDILLQDTSPSATIELGGYSIDVFDKSKYSLKKMSSGKGSLKQYSIRGSLITQKGSASEFYEKHLRARRATDGLGALYRVNGMGIKGDGIGYRYITQPEGEKTKNGIYYQGKPLGKGGVDKGLPYQNFYDMVDEFNGVGYEGGIEFKNGKKPESFIALIFEIAGLKKDDLVLDYHVGSGTTAAVAHKMQLQYIGIEQLYYGDNDPMVRLQNVINGDQTGISKAVDWQGGGSFIYANITNNANKFRKRVEAAKDDKEYLALLEEATSSSFLSYRVDPTKLNENEFRKLSSSDKRRLLLELIDNNTLYVNYEDINDPSFKVSDADKKFNKELYK